MSHLQRQQWKMVVVSPRSKNSKKKKKKRRRRNKWNNRERERMYTHSTHPTQTLSITQFSLFLPTCTFTLVPGLLVLSTSPSLSSSCSLFLVSVSCYHCYWITDVYPFCFLINYYFTHSRYWYDSRGLDYDICTLSIKIIVLKLLLVGYQ